MGLEQEPRPPPPTPHPRRDLPIRSELCLALLRVERGLDGWDWSRIPAKAKRVHATVGLLEEFSASTTKKKKSTQPIDKDHTIYSYNIHVMLGECGSFAAKPAPHRCDLTDFHTARKLRISGERKLFCHALQMNFCSRATLHVL